ncbi:MAG: CHAD domain-containing protein [Alcanivoracaceae bacterium]
MPTLSVDTIRTHALAVHDDVRDMLSREGPLEEDCVHGLRVASKELRALWQLLKPVMDDQCAREALTQLRDVATSLSEARDQYVVLDTLKGLCAKARSRDTRAALDAALLYLRDHTPETLTQVAASPELQDSWQRDLQRWQALHTDILASDLRDEGFGRLYRKARKLTHAAIQSDDIHLWHALRKWVKYLALTLPVAGDSKAQERFSPDLTRLGKKLGKLHDLDRLLLALSELDWQGSEDQLGYINHEIRREISRLLSDCSALATRLFDPSPRAFLRRLG